MAARSRPERVLSAITAIETRLSRMSPGDRREMTAPARAARAQRLEDLVDPNRELDPQDRAARVSAARRAEMARLAARAVAARKTRREAERTAQIEALVAEAEAEGAA
ncbi:MAG TPA: hypothetical protein VFC00_29050 [Micromonosporaceae bacterium]|nr:hypothetical protein [Micromonosporaceae bacterium]